MTRGEARQIFLRQLEEFNRRPKAAAVFCVRRVLEILLKVHEGARRLDQPFEEIIVASVAVQPKLLQNIVRLVVTPLVPATKKRAIEWMIRYLAAPLRRVRPVAEKIDIVALELAHEARNPLAFAHEGLNFVMPQMMGKPTFPEGHESVRDRSQE